MQFIVRVAWTVFHIWHIRLCWNVLVMKKAFLTSKHAQQLISTDAALFNCGPFVLQPAHVMTVNGMHVSSFPGTNINILLSKTSL